MKALEHLSQNLQICSPILLVFVDRLLPVGPPSYMTQRTGKLDPQRSGVVSFFDFGRFISYPINSCRSHNLPVTPAAIPGVTLKVL